MSSEITITPMPSAASRAMMAWMSAFDPTSTPTVGPLRIKIARRPGQPPRQHHALLVAAGEAAHRQVGVRRDDAQAADPLGDQARANVAPATTPAASVSRSRLPDRDIARDRLGQEQPLGEPVRRNVADAEPHRVERRRDALGPPADEHPALDRPGRDQTRLWPSAVRPEPSSPVTPSTSPARNENETSCELPLPPEPFDPQQLGAAARVGAAPHAARASGRACAGIARRCRTSDARALRHLEAVAQDDDALADGEHLRQFVTDENRPPRCPP